MDYGSDASSNASPGNRTRLKAFGRKTATKTKILLHIDNTATEVETEQDGVYAELDQNTAFNPTELDEPSTHEKITETLHTAGNAMLHPRQYAKSKTAAALATSQQPYLSKDADRDLWDAHKALDRAWELTISDSDPDENGDVQDSQKVVDDLEARREMKAVAWTTGRFCHRVRVMARAEVSFPKRSEFQEFDEHGNVERFQWEKWLGHLMLYITQDKDSRCINESTASGSILDDTDFLCFQCNHNDVRGQLTIYSDGIRFIRRFPHKEIWRRSFGELVELNKFTGSSKAKLKLRKERLLEFTFVGGSVEQLEAIEQRDEAFNAIVGFSGLHWQQLLSE